MPGGRPRQWESPDEMQKAIDAYFERCDRRTRQVVVKEGRNSHVEELADPEPYTVTGLAMALDLTRQGLLNYEERPEFVDTIKRAKQRIEANTERRMLDGDGWGPGHIFSLKNNWAWKDTQTIDHEGPVVLRVIRDGAGADRSDS